MIVSSPPAGNRFTLTASPRRERRASAAGPLTVTSIPSPSRIVSRRSPCLALDVAISQSLSEGDHHRLQTADQSLDHGVAILGFPKDDWRLPPGAAADRNKHTEVTPSMLQSGGGRPPGRPGGVSSGSGALPRAAGDRNCSHVNPGGRAVARCGGRALPEQLAEATAGGVHTRAVSSGRRVRQALSAPVADRYRRWSGACLRVYSPDVLSGAVVRDFGCGGGSGSGGRWPGAGVATGTSSSRGRCAEGVPTGYFQLPGVAGFLPRGAGQGSRKRFLRPPFPAPRRRPWRRGRRGRA